MKTKRFKYRPRGSHVERWTTLTYSDEAAKRRKRAREDAQFFRELMTVGAIGMKLMLSGNKKRILHYNGTSPRRLRNIAAGSGQLERELEIPQYSRVGGNIMDEFDRKVIDAFPGKAVRKDLTGLMKKGANVPTYVLEYLLGMYCTTDDEEALKIGLEKIKRILSENYVRPDQSEYVKSKIKENGQYTIIDKITVRVDEKEDKYVATFTNLDLKEFEVGSDLVVHNEKLLVGGIWCIVKIEYVGLEENEEEEFETDIFEGNKQKQKKLKKKKSKYDSPFSIASLKPIQMANLDLDEIKNARREFTKDEWITLLLRSAGYEPDELSQKQKLHYLLRFVPFIQKNYNLVELGPRGTGKSHAYSELSPYSILMSSGHTTVSNMFYNMASHRVGLVGNWDCVAFDEVGGIKGRRTFSGLAKLIYPDEKMDKEEARELLEYAIECRRRVKEQLRKMNPAEFSDVMLGYIDLDTGEEIYVDLPEIVTGTLIPESFAKPGYVYAIGRSYDQRNIGIYRFENKLIEGSGKLSFRNVEGLAGAPKSVKDSITAAFNYFVQNSRRLIDGKIDDFDYSLYFNDLQNRNVSDEVSVAEAVGLFSAISNRPVMPSLVICGRVVMSGETMPVITGLDEIFVAAANAGAKKILLPENSRSNYEQLSDEIKREVTVVFYSTPLGAAKIALGVDL